MISRFLGIFLIISLVVVGAFALSVVGAHEHVEGYSCPISTIKGGGGCTTDMHDGVLASVFYHISSIHSFTQGVGGAGVNIALLTLLFLAMIIVLRIFSLNFDIPLSPLSIQRRHEIYEHSVRYQELLLKWISLRNKSVA